MGYAAFRRGLGLGGGGNPFISAMQTGVAMEAYREEKYNQKVSEGFSAYQQINNQIRTEMTKQDISRTAAMGLPHIKAQMNTLSASPFLQKSMKHYQGMPRNINQEAPAELTVGKDGALIQYGGVEGGPVPQTTGGSSDPADPINVIPSAATLWDWAGNEYAKKLGLPTAMSQAQAIEHFGPGLANTTAIPVPPTEVGTEPKSMATPPAAPTGPMAAPSSFQQEPAPEAPVDPTLPTANTPEAINTAVNAKLDAGYARGQQRQDEASRGALIKDTPDLDLGLDTEEAKQATTFKGTGALDKISEWWNAEPEEGVKYIDHPEFGEVKVTTDQAEDYRTTGAYALPENPVSAKQQQEAETEKVDNLVNARMDAKQRGDDTEVKALDDQLRLMATERTRIQAATAEAVMKKSPDITDPVATAKTMTEPQVEAVGQDIQKRPEFYSGTPWGRSLLASTMLKMGLFGDKSSPDIIKSIGDYARTGTYIPPARFQPPKQMTAIEWGEYVQKSKKADLDAQIATQELNRKKQLATQEDTDRFTKLVKEQVLSHAVAIYGYDPDDLDSDEKRHLSQLEGSATVYNSEYAAIASNMEGHSPTGAGVAKYMYRKMYMNSVYDAFRRDDTGAEADTVSVAELFAKGKNIDSSWIPFKGMDAGEYKRMTNQYNITTADKQAMQISAAAQWEKEKNFRSGGTPSERKNAETRSIEAVKGRY